MAKKPLSKRLLALLLTVAVIFSSFATLSFSAFAAAPVAVADLADLIYDSSVAGMTDVLPFSIENKVISFKDDETNLLAGKEYEVYSFNESGTVQSITDANVKSVANCTDGVLGADADIWAGGTGRTVDVVYHLGNTVTPEYFSFIQRETLNLQTYKYDVYGATTYTELRTKPVLLGTYDRTDDATVDHQVHIFDFPETAPRIKFLMIRLYEENYNCAVEGYRPVEFILLGNEADDADNTLHESESATVPTEHALTAKSVTVYKKDVEYPYSSYIENLQDGAVGTSTFIGLNNAFSTDLNSDGTQDTWLDEGEYYVDVVYDLGVAKNISNVLVANYSGAKKFRMGKYKLYASKSREELFENEIAEYSNTGAVRRQLFNFSNTVGRYVAIRVLKPVAFDSQIIDYNLWIEEFRVYGSDAVVMHQVEFLDRMGKVIHTAEVEHGTTIPEDDVLAATEAVPAIYGYKKYIDQETGMQVWNKDVAEYVVNAPATFTALYVRNSATYNVSVQKVGEEAVTLEPMKFDERIVLIDEEAEVWTVNGEITAEGTNTCAYVFGDMAIVAEASAPAEATSVSIIGINKDGGSLTAFAHIYNTDPSVTVEKFGIIFVSGTTYDKIKDWDDWSESTLNTDPSLRHARTTITADSTNYMSTLTGIPTDRYVRRICRAYAVLSDGTTVYSDAIVNEFGSK